MVKIIFLVATIILITVVVYFTLKRKVKCLKCSSTNVGATGEIRYNEDNLAFHGSPNSSHELEYKCNQCGNTFWEPKRSAIFN